MQSLMESLIMRDFDVSCFTYTCKGRQHLGRHWSKMAHAYFSPLKNTKIRVTFS